MRAAVGHTLPSAAVPAPPFVGRGLRTEVEEVPPTPSTTTEEQRWVRFQVVDESYSLHLDDRVVQGRTDAEGLLEVGEVPSGDYRLEIGGVEAKVPTLPLRVSRREFRIAYRYVIEPGADAGASTREEG